MKLVGEQKSSPSACEWHQRRVAKQGQSPVESRDGGPVWEPGRQRASFQGRTEGHVRVRQGIGPQFPGVSCVPILQQLSASKMGGTAKRWNLSQSKEREGGRIEHSPDAAVCQALCWVLGINHLTESSNNP